MKRRLFLSHRWLGIALSLLFVGWFISGVVMMYVRMPILTPAERFARLPRLEMTRVKISPQAALARSGLQAPPKRVRLNVVLGRPAYHFLPAGKKWVTVFADDGTPLPRVSPQQAALAASSFAPAPAPPRFLGTVPELDQWTLTNSLNLHRPLHRFAIADAAQTEIYVSQITGEVVMRSTGAERKWAWLGPILHWGAPEFFRKQVALWRNSLLWLSVAGTLLTLTGLFIGAQRLRRGGYQLKNPDGEKVAARSPYRGVKKWHHWSGMLFGFFTFTWIFSGLLYTNPGGARSKPTSTVTTFTPYNEGGIRADLASKPVESAAMNGGALLPALFELPPAAAALRVREQPAPREIDLVRFGGEPFYVFYSDWNQSRSVSAADGAALTRFDTDALIRRAQKAVPNGQMTQATLLETYDAYYYSVGNVAQKRLPVLQVRFSEGTWFYINPHDGTIFRRYDAHGRAMRWLINGLHCLDFPFLMFNRPAWDATIIFLSLGGLVLSLSGVAMGFRRLFPAQARRKNRAARPAEAVLQEREKVA